MPPGYRMRRPRRRRKLERYTAIIDRILEGRPRPAEEAASHRKAYPRASEGRARASAAGTRRSRTTSESVASRPGRCSCRCPILRDTPSATSERRGRSLSGVKQQGALLRAGPSAQRRDVREGVPGRDHRGVLRRTRLRVLVPGRSPTERPVRQHQARRGQDTGRRPATAAQECSPSFSPTTCSQTGSDVPARATTRGRWRAW